MIKKENLKKYIEKKYVSLNKAAVDIGVSPSCLSRLINGKRDVGKKTIVIFSNYCKRNNIDLKKFIYLG